MSEASNIAQSLQQILKQARSIRGDETTRVKAERPTTVRGDKTSIKVKRIPQHTITSVGRSTRGATSRSRVQKHTIGSITVSNSAFGRVRKTPHPENRPKSEGGTTLDMLGVIWKEVARYDKARTRLLGLFSSHDGKSTDTTTGHGLYDGDRVLLGALKGRDTRHLEQGTLPYPIYITWLKLLYPSAVGGDHSRGVQKTADEWERVVRLQRSLVMLLDEVEGRREVAAYEDQVKGRKDSAGGLEWRRGSRGAVALLPEFEDWYCSNKVQYLITSDRVQYVLTSNRVQYLITSNRVQYVLAFNRVQYLLAFNRVQYVLTSAIVCVMPRAVLKYPCLLRTGACLSKCYSIVSATNKGGPRERTASRSCRRDAGSSSIVIKCEALLPMYRPTRTVPSPTLEGLFTPQSVGIAAEV